MSTDSNGGTDLLETLTNRELSNLCVDLQARKEQAEAEVERLKVIERAAREFCFGPYSQGSLARLKKVLSG